MADLGNVRPANREDGSGDVVLPVQAGKVEVSGGSADLSVTDRWEAISLALFGVIWGIVVTVSGVAVALLWPGSPERLWALAVYSVVSLGVLTLALVVAPRPFRRAMRWVRYRGDRSARHNISVARFKVPSDTRR